MKNLKIFLIVIVFFFLFIITSCTKDNNQNKGYDGKTFDISIQQNKQLTAKLKKINNNYELTITGTGNTKDYARKEEVPWYAISKKITNVIIEDGIENIGDYFFYSLSLTNYYLPNTIKEIAENSFNKQAIIYSYSTEEIITNATNKIYYYSDTKPVEQGTKWRMIGETPVVWDEYKVLFIGNSFTYYPSTESNPAVCTIFKELAQSLNIDVTVNYVVKGSHTLKKFANETDEKGKIVDELLKANDDYDFVILQEQSTTPANDYNSFNQAVLKLTTKIKETQKNAQVILYATWGFPSAITEKGVYNSVGEMEQTIRSAYEKCASENDLKVSYVGKTFTYVYENYKDINLYYSDSKHQSLTGAYLSASVHLVTLFNVDVRASIYKSNLTEETATILKNVAYEMNIK